MRSERPINPNKINYAPGTVVEFTVEAKKKFTETKLGIKDGKLVDFDFNGTLQVIKTVVHSGTGPNSVILKDKNGVFSGPMSVTHIKRAAH